MSRLVQPSRAVLVSGAVTRGGPPGSAPPAMVSVGGDGFMDRVAKYIPGEVLAGYMSLDRGLVPDPGEVRRVVDAAKTAGATRAAGGGGGGGAAASQAEVMQLLLPYLPGVVFVIGLIFTPLYIWQLSRNSGGRTPWMTQAIVSTLAFVVWAYAIQGSFFLSGFATSVYHGSLAAAAVILFTLVSGVFAPAPISTPHAES